MVVCVCVCWGQNHHHPRAASWCTPLRVHGFGLGLVGSHPALVHGVQHVLAVDGERVRGRQHLLLALLLQRGEGVLLGQPHLADQLRHVVVQQLLGALQLQERGEREEREREGWREREREIERRVGLETVRERSDRGREGERKGGRETEGERETEGWWETGRDVGERGTEMKCLNYFFII